MCFIFLPILSLYQFYFIFQGLQNEASKAIYVEVNDRIEKWSQIVHFVLVNVSIPFLILPKYLVSFYLYYTTDMGNDAFELPLPMW